MTTEPTNPVYIADDRYFALVDAITTPATTPVFTDARSRTIELLGEIANLWPVSILVDE